ncbi:hypothetical protein HMI55_006294, partial [Coelomomyces lativittatus]
DGPEAGQTVPHVHIHILPRVQHDFKNNDDIYPAIEKNESQLIHMDVPKDEDRPPRTLEDMEKEAKLLRTHFQLYEPLD